MPDRIELVVEQGDIRMFKADVVALKHAQAFYGADRAIANALSSVGFTLDDLSCPAGEHRYVRTRGAIDAQYALFVGVQPLARFGYEQVRAFATSTLGILAEAAPNTRHLAMTIHGPGFGLDEVETLLAQSAGYLDAIRIGRYPVSLERITIVERDHISAERLRRILNEHLRDTGLVSAVPGSTGYFLQEPASTAKPEGNDQARQILSDVGKQSAAKAHAFVAMPFNEAMSDVFHYGIRQPVHAAGLLCVRVDQHTFTGDILETIKQKIQTATVVIADLTGANANVYLEVGFAWGTGRPTILVSHNADDLGFDVRGQRCLVYKNIQNLEQTLTRELEEFLSTAPTQADK